MWAAVGKFRRMLSRVVIALMAGLPCSAGAAFAQQQVAGQQLPAGQTTIAKQVAPNKAAPLLLQADDLIYDNRNNRVIARGNVEVYYDDNVLLANEIIYDKSVNTLSAVGNVRLKEADGAVVNAERLLLKSNFRDGFVRSLSALTQDDTRVAAANAYKKDNQTIYERGVVTSCKPCEQHPESPPIWRVKATRVVQDNNDHNFYYEDALVEVYGIPVAWVPYFYTPDNTVQQRSGFLQPQYSFHSSTTGYSLTVPYYYAASPNYDITLSPTITTQAGYLMEADWRQKLWNGAYEVKLYGSFDPTANDFWGDRNWRGSAETKGSFTVAKGWTFGWNGIIESDETFRRFYNIDSIYAYERVSTMYLTGIGDRNYFNMAVSRYGNLLGQSLDYSTNTYLTNTVTTTAYPVIDYNYVHNKPVFGGEFSFDVNAVALSINDPSHVSNIPNLANVSQGNTQHIAADAQWRRTFKDELGQVYTPFVFVRGDVYNVSSFIQNNISGPADTFTRELAGVGFDYRYPFILNTEGGSHVIEPVAQIVSRAGQANNALVPITDAQSLIFSDALLFDINKFSGWDQIETGTRTNFGVQYTFSANNGISVRTTAGESIQIAGPNAYSLNTIYQGSGLENVKSDYVLGTYVDYKNMFRGIAQIRVNEKDGSLDNQSYTLQTKLGFLQAGVSYESIAAQPTLGFLQTRQEVSGFGALKVTDEWSVFGDLRYDFEYGTFIRNSAGIQYADECVIYSLAYQQTNVTLQDIKPDTAFVLRVGIKGFGQQSVPTSIYDLSPEAASYR
jgi:LPS-assembly protein